MTVNRTVGAIAIALLIVAASTSASERDARELIRASGVDGGLVVHVGCGAGELTAGLRVLGSYTVQGLDTDPKNVEAARRRIGAESYGPVSVDVFDGKHLPYIDNLVSLVVSEDLGDVPQEEVLRVLSPRGVGLVKSKGVWRRLVKPVPANIDDWNHYLHGPDNNAVGNDTVVGPPRRMQWVGRPMFARSHEINSSVAALISEQGRLFYIWDDNPTGMTDKRFPSKWRLIARDAFNGVVLWKRPMPDWGWRQWHPESRWDDKRERAKMLRMLPATSTRRLVASGGRVYVTLGYTAPVSVLDATTGETIAELPDTKLTDEILCVGDSLVLCVREPDSPPERDVWNSVAKPARGRVRVVSASDGKLIWQSKADQMAPMSLAASHGKVFYSDYTNIVALDLATGRELWRSDAAAMRSGNRGTVGTLVAREKVVLLTSYPGGGKKDSGRLHALSAQTGKLLWQSAQYIGPGITNPPDLFVASGLVWIGETKSRMSHQNLELRRQGFDPVTGEVKREIVVPKLISWGHHYRCYRSKATERYLMLPKRGIEMVDLKENYHSRHDWIRPPCIYGVLPANGMIYTTPHQCVCYQGTLLSYFNAFAPRMESGEPAPATEKRLLRGAAWGKAVEISSGGEDDWPTYRHDPRRSGMTTSKPPGDLSVSWTVQLRAPVTPPVVASGMLLVAERDAHEVSAHKTDTGERVWSFTAGGRVDSPPTIHNGLVLFGSTDGRVYCLRLSDGQEVWRFIASPSDRRLGAFGQVESVWPVHGSVLVQNDVTVKPPRKVAYFTAGRSSFLDGGIKVYGLDPATGKVLYENVLAGPHHDPHKDKGGAGYADGSKTGILTSDGADIFLFQERLRSDLKRVPAKMQQWGKEGGGFRVYPAAPDRGSSAVRLMTTHGYLANADNEGKYWLYSNRWPGWDRHMRRVGAFGQLLSFSDRTLYGVHVFTDAVRVRRGRELGGKGQRLFARDHGQKKDRWSKFVKIRVRAMTIAGDSMIVAGPPDVVPAADPMAAIEGRRGAKLLVISSKTGSKTAESKLDAVPVFDGMIVAGGSLYVSMKDGKIVRIGK